ncbi:hypothetical protein [Marisediminicola senii]|uniref:hypothetical protein n=1 Tax=Marisediminicola senii TaxID=2711233 RepID=UPI0013E9CEEB|nr:hypothetical protein [Marisediminicola senii]
MPTEAELRAMLRDAATPRDDDDSTPDATRVIRRSRARRRPKQLLVGATAVVAVAGIGFAGIAGISALTPAQTGASSMVEEAAGDSAGGTAGESAPMDPEGAASGAGIGRAPANKLNLCGGTLAEVAPSATGLVLTTNFAATAPAGTNTVEGTVTMTNTSTEHITGTTAATPAITVSQNGRVLWHSNGMMIMMAALVDLAPGASMEYPASFTPVECSVEDDSAESFRTDLPALEPGSYDVSAAIDITLDSAAAGSAGGTAGNTAAPVDLVTGPTAPVTLQ